MAFNHHIISFATDLAANFECNQFRIMPDIVSKYLRSAIWSCCAVQFESEQTPFPWTVHISFAIYWAANFGCTWIDSESCLTSFPSFCAAMRAALWSRCAAWFESEQTPYPQTGHRIRSAALHGIRFRTCVFVHTSYFYSETNEWLQDWVKRWAQLWSATTSRQFHRKFHFTRKKKSDS